MQPCACSVICSDLYHAPWCWCSRTANGLILASWRLLEWVLATHSSILIVACVRWEEIPEELRTLQRRAEAVRMTASGIDLDDPVRFCRIMEVEELSDDLMRELIARTLGSSPPERELADRISALACGNPLFAEEITLKSKDGGINCDP